MNPDFAKQNPGLTLPRTGRQAPKGPPRKISKEILRSRQG